MRRQACLPHFEGSDLAVHFSGLTSEMLIDPSLSLSVLTASRLLCRCSNSTPTLNDVQMTDESSHNERALLWSRGQVLTLASHACCVLLARRLR